MKRFILTAIISLASASAFAAQYKPMNIVEKASYQLSGLVTKGKVDATYLTDVNHVTVSQSASGFQIQLSSPSADANSVNTLDIAFDLNGKATGYAANFVSAYPQGPVFSSANAATILDLAAEAFVDHLSESQDNVVVADNVRSMDLSTESSGVLIVIHLATGQDYTVHMDAQGNVLSKGF